MTNEILPTKILPPTPENIALCVKTIAQGGVVAFGTETVYGLGANALDAAAVQKIFDAKARPSDNPLIVHIAEYLQLDGLVLSVPPKARLLMQRFMPGPLTLIFKKSPAVPAIVTAGLDTVAVRMPAHQAALDLIAACGVPLAAPSANRSGTPSPTTAQHVYDDVGGRIPYILDGGMCTVGIESTVLDLTSDTPVILRVGAVAAEEIEKVIGPLAVAGYGDNAADAGVVRADTAETPAPRSPGQKYRHYAPRAEVIAADYHEAMHERIAQLYDGGVSIFHKNPVILCLEKNRPFYGNRNTFSVGADAADYARNLYALLRRADDDGYDTVFAECVPVNGIGAAVMNRLAKAGEGSGKNTELRSVRHKILP
ncbi:MAG: L-threonylcarbamoyladenylate synthase [Firmicutes bacterium]|nr:L-threonylcarbamoyladenylate synthase [Bacillota bacterium]